MSAYSDIETISAAIPADRQGAKRHYGVHPYFTRRPFNVVQKYILNYSQEGDWVLDPFGGSGVTAIEAFLENRIGIQNDINPLANFIAQGVVNLREGQIADYERALVLVQKRCEVQLREIADMDSTRLLALRSQLRLPDNVSLPSNSDVDLYYDLFSDRQLVSLAVLKSAIDDLERFSFQVS